MENSKDYENKFDSASYWLPKWNDETLQSTTIRQLAQDIIGSILYSKSLVYNHERLASALVIGERGTGKSYTLQQIHKYIKGVLPQSIDGGVHWTQLPVYSCEATIKQIMAQAPPLASIWKVYVTENVTREILDSWKSSNWFNAWQRYLYRTTNNMWIVLCSGKYKSNDEDSTFSQVYSFQRPSSKTIYHFMKKKIFLHYRAAISGGEQKRNPFPDYVKLPIVEYLPELASFIDTLVNKLKPTFKHMEALFELSLQHCSLLLYNRMDYMVCMRIIQLSGCLKTVLF